MAFCYLCENILTESNLSNEHIILNSIGGRLKSKELLCSTCNSKFGHKADGELSKQLAFITSHLQVKRDNREHPTLKGLKTKDGTVYNIVDGSYPVLAKPQIIEKDENGEVKLTITARNEKELISVINGMKRKHPELDLDSAKKKFELKNEYLNESLHHEITIGGELAFQSIAKTAVNYYILTQKDTEHVKHLFPYLKDLDKLDIVKHFHPIKPIYKKESNEIIHLIHLYGNRKSRQLYCFIEFFSAFSFFVLLSDSYEGKNISCSYSYDILKSKEVTKNVTLKLKPNDINEIFTSSKLYIQDILEKINRVTKIGDKIQADKQLNIIIRKSFQKMLEKHKGETVFTEQMLSDISKDIAHEYVRFTSRFNKIRNK